MNQMRLKGVLVFIIVVFFGVIVYFFVVNKPTTILQQAPAAIPILDKGIGELSVVTEKRKDGWETYTANDLDITFDYPATWQFQEGTHFGGGGFWVNFNTSGKKQVYGEASMDVVGINDTYISEGDPGWFGYCAVEYKDIDEFCKEGCEKINNNVAVDYRRVFHGDSGFSAIAYTNLSRKYPSVCFELNLTQVVREIGDGAGINYYDVLKQYDIKSMIKNSNVSDSMVSVVNNFENIIRSIKKK